MDGLRDSRAEGHRPQKLGDGTDPHSGTKRQGTAAHGGGPRVGRVVGSDSESHDLR